MSQERDFFEDTLRVERVSHRFSQGVEILERETVQRIRTEPVSHTAYEPRVVISEAESGARPLISKTRSELGEIDALLRSLIKRPAFCK